MEIKATYNNIIRDTGIRLIFKSDKGIRPRLCMVALAKIYNVKNSVFIREKLSIF
ncbi:hypothetical protein GCM10011501_34150 [Thalassotalea profundi]|uniref:Uncharacterized protein n=1 Tax=Thalassotalea profundi TaxID=2036687 RepID=A0ABQ3J2D2_9GAMM|nr:hypothetical protein GCM10011501_34150 [Thalassotalea profundi]